MAAGDPLLSVVIPTRNRKDMALQAARSALTALSFPHEVILSDNASDGGFPLPADLVGLRYIRRAGPLPMAEHWNLCVEECRGRYVKVLCDDDWLLPGALEREVGCLEKDGGLSLAASARWEVSDEDEEAPRRLKRFASRPVRLAGSALFFQMLAWENIIGPPSCVTFRKSSFRGFPPAYRYAADWAAWILLAERGGIALLPEPGAKFRLHSGNLTKGYVESGTDFLEVQALRGECLRRLRGGKRLLGSALFAWIWAYRFSRRVLRYAARLQGKELAVFLRRLTGS